MRAIALDIGGGRCGIAATDASGRVAMPVKVLPMGEVLSGARSWKRIQKWPTFWISVRLLREELRYGHDHVATTCTYGAARTAHHKGVWSLSYTSRKS